MQNSNKPISKGFTEQEVSLNIMERQELGFSNTSDNLWSQP